LAGTQGFGLESQRVQEIAEELADALKIGAQIAIVVGGGNIFRGVAQQARDMDRVFRRSHGHAGHGDQRARVARRAGKSRAYSRGFSLPS